MKIKLVHSFEDIISIDNFLMAWKEFIKGKRNKPDVQEFQMRLMDNIFSLHFELLSHCYKHGGYNAFKISDPKPRIIHKASVRDRLLHKAVYRILYPFFDKTFIADSFSCRIGRGTHAAVNRFKFFANKASKNNTENCWVLKCDVKRFFASIDQNILLKILTERIPDKDVLKILEKVIFSFHSTAPRKGLPLGNLTSQLFANVYMNEFDQFAKHKLKIKHYIRYADDFVVLSEDSYFLKKIVSTIQDFMDERLKLQIHSEKTLIKTLTSGIDFLGWVNFLDHRILRNKTKKRMLKVARNDCSLEALISCLGFLNYGNTNKIKNEILKLYFENHE